MMKRLLFILSSICFTLGLFAQESVNREKMIISTDRDVYIAGDRLYFAVKLTDITENAGEYAYISMNSTSGSRIFTGCFKTNDGNSYGSIYLADTLATGIYQLVSFTNCMRNYGAPAFARKNILVANRFDTDFSILSANSNPENSGSAVKEVHPKYSYDIVPVINTDKNTYKQREKVAVDIQIPESIRHNLLSVSVRQAAPVSFPTVENLQQMPASAMPCRYLPERSGLIIRGTLKNTDNAPVPFLPVFLSCEDTVANLQSVTTNADGVFRFFLNPYYFGKLLSIKSDETFHGSIEIDDKFGSESGFDTPALKISGDLSGYLVNSQKYLTINKSYKQEFLKESINPGIGAGYRPPVYFNALLSVLPSDYTYLPDFIEISREILPYIKTRQINGDYTTSIFDPILMEYVSPYIFVDGILIENVNQIISLDSKKIRKIEILPNERFVGDFPIPGVVSITTTNHEIENLRWNHPIRKTQADSIMRLAAWSPAPVSKLSRHLPDYRQLLYWEPSFTCGNSNVVSFETFASDLTGTFEIVMIYTGIDGKATECKKIFEVVH